jgi:hypothetical protein
VIADPESKSPRAKSIIKASPAVIIVIRKRWKLEGSNNSGTQIISTEKKEQALVSSENSCKKP